MRRLWMFGVLGVVGCTGVPQDSWPPRLLTSEVAPDGSEIVLTFDEPVARASSAIDAAPLQPAKTEGPRVKVNVPAFKPGEGHLWSAEAEDGTKNLTTAAGKFYAANPHPAELRLNEIRVAGSGNHPDLVEIRVEAEGSLGGCTVEVWSTPDARQRMVLPDDTVNVGELLVVRYQTPGKTDTAAGVKEYWQNSPKGLSASKGLILLRQRPDGPVVDALAYSKKMGEGLALAQAEGWTSPMELNPTACSATRTWCRTEDPEAPWMLVANGAATPGELNKLTPWRPPSSPSEAPRTKTP